MDTLEMGATNNNSNNNNNNSNNDNDNDGPHQRYTRSNTSECCWLHVVCAHKGGACTRKKTGHKNDATLAKKMGVARIIILDSVGLRQLYLIMVL